MACQGQSMGFVNDIRASRAPALGFAAMGLVWAAFAAQVPVLKAQIGASDAQFGMCFLVSSLVALAAVWVAPAVDRRLGRFSVAVASVAVGASILIPSVATNLVFFTFGMVFASASSGILDIVINARVAEAEEARGRPLMNLNHGTYSFVYAGMALVTGGLREAGLAPVQVFAGILGLILLATPLMRTRPAAVAGEESVIPQRADHLLVWLAGLVFLIGFLSEQAGDGWSALHLERTLGGGAAEGALGPAILGLTMGFGRLFGQIIAARVADTVMISLACVVAAVGVVIAALAPTLLVAYAGFAVMGLGVSVVVPLAMAIVGRMVPHAHRVAAIGRASIIGYGAFLVGPSLIGLTSDVFGLRVAFLVIAALLMVVPAILVPLLVRRVQATA